MLIFYMFLLWARFFFFSLQTASLNAQRVCVYLCSLSFLLNGVLVCTHLLLTFCFMCFLVCLFLFLIAFFILVFTYLVVCFFLPFLYVCSCIECVLIATQFCLIKISSVGGYACVFFCFAS